MNDGNQRQVFGRDGRLCSISRFFPVEIDGYVVDTPAIHQVRA